MLNGADPAHASDPDVDVAESVIENPIPAGSGLIVVEIVALWCTSMTPDLVKDPGPVIA